MDSDDDFLIDDDEDTTNEVKDELYQAGKAHHTTPVHPGPVSHSSTSSPNKSAIPFALQHEMVAPGSQAQHSGPHHPQQHSNGSPGHQGPSPALVVAPKPLTTHQANKDAPQTANQAYGAATTSADVLKGIQEGGNALLKRLGDFFQTPATYTATAGASGRSSSADPGADIFFNDVYAKFMEELQNADSMTFPVLDDFINDFNGQESLRFDGSDLIEKQERDYFALKEKRMAKLELLISEGKEGDRVSDEEAIAAIAEQNVSRDKAVSDGEYQTKVLREHQSSRGQMFQNIVFCATALFKKLLIWPDATDSELLLISDCIEEYLIPHVQKKLYCPDRWTDWRFAQVVGSTQFIQPSALGISVPVDANLINRCGALLTEVNFLPTPRRKLAAIVQAGRYIMSYLVDHPMTQANARKALEALQESQTEDSPAPGADASHIGAAHSSTTPTSTLLHSGSDTSNPETPANGAGATSETPDGTATSLSHSEQFLATLIYVLIQTNPPNLLSNVAYLITCRSSSDSMLTEEGYYFAHVAIAVHFLCKLKESKSVSQIGLEGGVFLLEPEWMPMMIEKEARLLHLLPSLNTSRAANEIVEYKSTIRRLVLDITKRNAKKKADAIALQSLIDANPPPTYTPEQIASYQQEPMNFFSEHRMWALHPDDFKSPGSITNLLSEYKRLLINEYRHAAQNVQQK